jgi:hypothetical protein
MPNVGPIAGCLTATVALLPICEKACQFLDCFELYLGHRVAVGLQQVFSYAHLAGYLGQRLQPCLASDLQVVRYLGWVYHSGTPLISP